MLKTGLILSMIIGSTAVSCYPVDEYRISYCLAVQFNQNETQNTFRVCNLAEIGKKRQLDKILSGPNDTCRANASGVAIPARKGDIVMLIDRQPGQHPESEACYYGLLKEAKEPELSEGSMPRFIFVPTGGTLDDSVEVGHQRLSEYGIDNLKILIEDNVDQTDIPDEKFLERFECSFSALKDSITSSSPACNSLATYQIPLL